MKGSRKGSTPPLMQGWIDMSNDDWRPSYPFDCAEVTNEVRSTLLLEQRGLCVYCGRRLNTTVAGTTYHVEHFWPQSQFQNRATDYSNLYLSCGLKDDAGQPAPTCGNFKANWFEEKYHVAPEYPPCTQRFRFSLNGQVAPALEGDTAARNMIERLNLNHPELIKDRENILSLLDQDELDETDFFANGMAESYAHVAYQHLGLLMP
ncbi:TIGR02646 family protein [Agrobacterium tumefaciens]|nr:TIGR02646 family protein [Agrobacterium tumefaciens]